MTFNPALCYVSAISLFSKLGYMYVTAYHLSLFTHVDFAMRLSMSFRSLFTEDTRCRSGFVGFILQRCCHGLVNIGV